MGTLKKVVFLSNKNNNNSMAILTLDKKNNNIFCTIKTYNLDNSNDLVLGLKINDKIIKQNIILNNSTYNFLITKDLDINKSIGSVLMQIHNGELTPIIWGSEKNDLYKNEIVNSLRLELNHNITKEKIATKTSRLDKNSDNYKSIDSISNDENKEINNDMNFHPSHDNYNNLPGDEITNIAMANNTAKLFEYSDEDIENDIDSALEKSDHPFYTMISDQLDELFDKYPREESLEKLVENSKWVRINTDEKNRYYVVGIIYVDGEVRYICYGVPGDYNTAPPRELQGYSQWLPVDVIKPYENGYWVMYQDANTGENVFIN